MQKWTDSSVACVCASNGSVIQPPDLLYSNCSTESFRDNIR